MSVLLSIIVPIYNAETFLCKCLDSIVNQTYTNLEIVLVDDGSTDKSREICNNFADKDDRIKVIHKRNEGLVEARKSGVAISSGEYIGYVDADDYVEYDYYDKMMETAQKEEADIVVSCHYHDLGEDSLVIKNGITIGTYLSTKILDKLIYTGSFFEYGITPQVYTKIFKRDILKKVQKLVPSFIVAGEDAAVTYPSICDAKRICITDIVGYHYVQHMGSMTKTEYTNEIERVDTLIDYLGRVFHERGKTDKFENQLKVYRSYLLSLRQISYFDEGSDTILIPFGGLGEGDRVIIYGAGVLGQKIYGYLKKRDEVKIVAWVDKNYKVYQNNLLPVNHPNEIVKLCGQYDYVIVANITEQVYISIKEYLLDIGVSSNKILWFSKEFRQE